MIRLTMPAAPYWLDLPGCRVHVRPLTMTINNAAVSAAGAAVRSTYGEPPKEGEAWPEDNDMGLRNAAFTAEYALALGRYGIDEFEGVVDADGKPLDVTPQTVAQFLSVPALGSAFLQKYSSDAAVVVAEGNA